MAQPCHRYGKTLPSLWQSVAIVVSKSCHCSVKTLPIHRQGLLIRIMLLIENCRNTFIIHSFSLHLQRSLHRSPCGVGKREQDILEGVYYALVLTLEILRKFHFVIQNKAAVNVPGYAIYIPSMPYGHWCIHAPMATFGIVGCLYISVWGFGVVRFNDKGNSQEPQEWSERQCRASHFFYVFILIPSTTLTV